MIKVGRRAIAVALVPLALACLWSIACSDGTAPEHPPTSPHRAATIRLVSGDNQTGTVGTKLAQPIVIEMLDSVGKPVWGRPVSGTQDGEITADRNGRVVIPWQLDFRAGTQSIKIEPSGQDHYDSLVVTVHVTALPGPLDHIAPRRLPSVYSNWLTTSTIQRDQLFSPRDTFDNVVAWPADAKLSATSPWDVSGDTVVPPSPDFVGTTVIRVDAGGKSATSPVTRVDDLRTHRWNVSYACGTSGTPADEHRSDGALTDSLTFVGTLRVIAYPGDADYYVFQKAVTPPIQVYPQGILTRYLHDGTTSTLAVRNIFPHAYVIAEQRPDTLVFFDSANANGATGPVAVKSPGPLPRYVGGSWCDPKVFTVRPPMVWSAY